MDEPGQGLQEIDWLILGRDLLQVLRGLWRARGLVDAGIVSWEDLGQEVAIHLHKLESRGRGYDPTRAPLVAYVAKNADLVCLQLYRRHVTRRAHKRDQLRQEPPSWATGSRAWQPPALVDLDDKEQAWVNARRELGSTDAASAAADMTQREGRALAARLREALT